jgi:DNA end-binding protein Ku
LAVDAKEVKLATSLIEQMQLPEFDATEYADDYAVRVRALIDSKLKGKKLAVPASDQPDVINFMDALRKSVKAVPVPEKRRAPKPVPLHSTARKTAPAKKASRAKSG